MAGQENPDTSKNPVIPPVVRTVAYIGGALGVAAIYAGVEGSLDTVAKVLVGFALALGVTFNPSFGIGSKK